MEKINAVTLSDPEIIDAYSLDGERKYKNDMSGLKYLKIPNFKNNPINLNAGDYKDKDKNYDTLERIKHMTSYIKDNPEGLIKDHKVDANFVCFRGALKNLMTTPYNKDPNWIVKAVKFKGTIYFIIELNYDNYTGNKNPDDKSYQYGFKFESYVLSSDYDKPPKGQSEIVNENEKFCILMTRNIADSTKILFGIESDGVESEKVNDLDDLKKSKLAEVKIRLFKRFPLPDNTKLDWWCQSYIAAIDRIHVGYRDSKGIVDREVEIFKTKLLVEETKKLRCLEFLNKFLDQVKQYMSSINDPNKVFCITWNQKKEEIDVKQDKSTINFLSDEYIEFMNNH